MKITVHGLNADELCKKINEQPELSEADSEQFYKLNVTMTMTMEKYMTIAQAICALHTGAHIAEDLLGQDIPEGLCELAEAVETPENFIVKDFKVLN